MSDKGQYRKSPRAHFFEYDEGEYFITICTDGMEQYFGIIVDRQMHLSVIGRYVERQIKDASTLFPEVAIGEYVVMPNHIHMMVRVIDSRRNTDLCAVTNMADSRITNAALRQDTRRYIPTLSRYVNSFKGAVTKYAARNNIIFRWQPRYHDRVIRGPREANAITMYIRTNVEHWKDDGFYV